MPLLNTYNAISIRSSVYQSKELSISFGTGSNLFTIWQRTNFSYTPPFVIQGLYESETYTFSIKPTIKPNEVTLPVPSWVIFNPTTGNLSGESPSKINFGGRYTITITTSTGRTASFTDFIVSAGTTKTQVSSPRPKAFTDCYTNTYMVVYTTKPYTKVTLYTSRPGIPLGTLPWPTTQTTYTSDSTGRLVILISSVPYTINSASNIIVLSCDEEIIYPRSMNTMVGGMNPGTAIYPNLVVNYMDVNLYRDGVIIGGVGYPITTDTTKATAYIGYAFFRNSGEQTNPVAVTSQPPK